MLYEADFHIKYLLFAKVNIKIILTFAFNELIDAIHSQECAYTAVLFRMAMQYGCSIVLELLDMK